VFHTSLQFYRIRTAQASRRARSPDFRRNVESVSAAITVMQTPFMASLCDSAACDLFADRARCATLRARLIAHATPSAARPCPASGGVVVR